MTNKEFYKDTIFEIACKGHRIAVDKNTHKPGSCAIKCNDCAFFEPYPNCSVGIEKWANAEYVPFVDWSNVAVDTPIFVSDSNFTAKIIGVKRHFAKYEDGIIYAFENGQTSWTTDKVNGWEYARLATDEELKK